MKPTEGNPAMRDDYIASDPELLARMLSEQENAQDRGLAEDEIDEAAARATIDWDEQGRPTE